MPVAADKTKSRLNLDVPNEVRSQLDDLVARSTCSTLTDVVRRSLALYDLVLEHTHEGGKVVFRHEDGSEEVLRIL